MSPIVSEVILILLGFKYNHVERLLEFQKCLNSHISITGYKTLSFEAEAQSIYRSDLPKALTTRGISTTLVA